MSKKTNAHVYLRLPSCGALTQKLPNKLYQLPYKYKFLKVMGVGGFGKVLRCSDRDTNSLVAIKIPLFEDSISEEVDMLRKLMRLKLDKHNIVKFHECFSVRHGEALVFESLEMSLYEYLGNSDVTLADTRTIIKQMATALKALKNIGVIHADIKLDNVMLVDKKLPLRAKLIDFGLAMDNSKARQGMELQTVSYRAPEIILGLPFSEAIDMWSVGCMLYSLLYCSYLFDNDEYYTMQIIIELLGQPPDELLNQGQRTHLFFTKTKSNSWRFKMPAEFWLNKHLQTPEEQEFSSRDDLKKIPKGSTAEAAEYEQCIELMKAMLTMDQNKRITPNEVLQHPFITQNKKSIDPLPTDQHSPPTTVFPSGLIQVRPTKPENTLQLEEYNKKPSTPDGDNSKQKKKNCYQRVKSCFKKRFFCNRVDVIFSLNNEDTEDNKDIEDTEDNEDTEEANEEDNKKPSTPDGDDSKEKKKKNCYQHVKSWFRKRFFCNRVSVM